MSMEETAVLLSIHPEWCQKIFRGEKTLPPLEHPVLTVDAYGNYHTNTEYIDNPEIPFCITYNNGRFWPPIAWSKFDRLKWSGD